MIIRMGSLVSLVFIGMALPPNALPQQSPKQPAITTLHSNTRLVMVDIVVHDKNGQPMHGLKAEDFELKENGSTQRFKGFEEHVAPTDAELAKAQTQIPVMHLQPGVFTNMTAAHVEGPLNVLLLDKLNTAKADQKAMEKQIRQYLANAKSDERIAIFGLTDHLFLLQGFTDDPEALRAAVTNTRGHDTSPFLAAPGQIQLEAFNLTGDDNDSDRQLTSSMTSGAGGGPDERQMPAFQLEMRQKLTMLAMNQMAQYLSTLPGRKNLIWFSGSFPVDIMPDMNYANGASDNPAGGQMTARSRAPQTMAAISPFTNTNNTEGAFLQTTALLSRSQVAVYPIDVKGLTISSNYTAQDNGCSGCNVKTIRTQEAGPGNAVTDYGNQNYNEHATMYSMADGTGGKAFVNTNNFAAAMGKALDDGSNYYTIVYTPTDARWNGSFRKIDVKLQQKGYTMSYRRGYFAEDTKKQKEAAGSGVSRGMQVALMRGAPEPTQLLFSTRVQPLGASTENELAPRNQAVNGVKGPFRRYRVDYAIDPREIRFTQGPDGNRHETLEFVIYVFDADGGRVVSVSDSINTVVTPAQYEQFRKIGVPFHQEVSVPVKGQYTLRVAMHDVEADLVGAVELPVGAVSGLPPLQASANTAAGPSAR